MSEQEKKFEGIVSKLGLSPVEAPAKIRQGQGNLFIGLPKEKTFQEHRISLTPEAVRLLVSRGNRVLIERGAGLDSHFSDNAYSEAGAQIADGPEEVFKCDTVLKVAPPTIEEINLMQTDQTLISPIHLPTLTKEYIKRLMQKKVTALAFEYIRDEGGSFPFVRSMSEIAGNSSILIAGEMLSNVSRGKGVLLGGITGVPPAQVVVLGAGVVGTNAARAALGMGATVKVFDNSIYKLMRLQEAVGHKVYTSIVSPGILEDALSGADLAIGAIHSKDARTDMIVSEEMVMKMKPGSAILDISIDQGGCFETSHVTDHNEPTYIEHEIIHYCVPNIPSRYAQTAAQAISNLLAPTLLRCNELGGIKGLLFEDSGFRHGTYLFKGNLSNKYLGEKFNIKVSNLDLLFAANI